MFLSPCNWLSTLVDNVTNKNLLKKLLTIVISIRNNNLTKTQTS